jgi:hypothetical protein
VGPRARFAARSRLAIQAPQERNTPCSRLPCGPAHPAGSMVLCGDILRYFRHAVTTKLPSSRLRRTVGNAEWSARMNRVVMYVNQLVES